MDTYNYRKRGATLEPTEAGAGAVAMAMGCWTASSNFRRDRKRCKNYTFGNQWCDEIDVHGGKMSEREYYKEHCQQPLQNNIIGRMVRSVTGIFRSRLAERAAKLQGRHLDLFNANGMTELYARTMEEYLISGLAVHRKRAGIRGGISGIWTDMVQPDTFFFDPMARDPRGHDLTVVGQIHTVGATTFLAAFARDEKGYKVLKQHVGDKSVVKVIEMWTRERPERRLCHDELTGSLLRVDADLWASRKALRDMPSKWMIDDVWRYTFLTLDGAILASGDSPFPGGRHPYVFKAYPFLDGEIHSFVGEIIDQQRYTNRLITLYDWVIRGTAKGVLLVPQGCIPKGVSVEDFTRMWSRFDGVITYVPQGGAAPHQVTGNTAGIGISDLLNIQLKMMEDVSGVNGALQGKLENQTMSGTLYSQQMENSLTSLRDILDSFDSFIEESMAMEALLMNEKR